MGEIKIARFEDAQYSFENGVGIVRVLEDGCPDCIVNRVRIKAGTEWRPQLYPFGTCVQMLLFIDGHGYIADQTRAYNIDEACVYVPDFDQNAFYVRAVTDLELVQLLPTMSDYDKADIGYTHMSLPRFRTRSEAWTYWEKFKTPGVYSSMLIEHRNLGRYSMGFTIGEGPNVVGDHIHNEIQQFYIVLPGSSFTYTARGEELEVKGGDITYTPQASHHGSVAKEGQRFDYVWFEVVTDGYPGGIL